MEGYVGMVDEIRFFLNNKFDAQVGHLFFEGSNDNFVSNTVELI